MFHRRRSDSAKSGLAQVALTRLPTGNGRSSRPDADRGHNRDLGSPAFAIVPGRGTDVRPHARAAIIRRPYRHLRQPPRQKW